MVFRLSERWPSRGYLVGIALTAPFLVNMIPTWIAALFVLPLLADIAVRGVRPMLRPTPILYVIYAFASLNLLAIATTPYRINVIYSMIWSGGVVVLFLLAAHERDRPEDIIKGIFACMVPIASLFAAAGLIKHALQLEGFVFGSLIDACFPGYPQGTAFCGDYNLFALFMAVAAVGLSVTVLAQRYSAWKTQLLLLTALALVITAGLFSGSRRFVFVVLLVPMVWVAYALWVRPAKEILCLALVPLIMITAVYGTLYQRKAAISNYESVLIEDVVTQMRSKLADYGTEKRSDEFGPSLPVTSSPYLPRSVSPDALAMTMTPTESFGLNSRLDRWRLGLKIAADNYYVFGSGFSYHEIFSCAFVECEHIDYPHSPILSAWVGFGIVGLLLTLAFYGITVWNLFAAGKEGLLSGASGITLSVLPYSLISGDTIFSLPHTMIAALLISVAATSARRANLSGKHSSME